MPRIISFVIAFAVIIGTGVLHGYRTNRWSVDTILIEAAARLDDVPSTIGDWVGTDQEIGPNALKHSEATRIFSRYYTNQKTGERISTLIVCGRPGPVAVHTPDVCFQGQGIHMLAEPTRADVEIGDNPENKQKSEFMTADFQSTKDVVPRRDRVYWSWNTERQWMAPENPRASFMMYPKLYKLYLVRSVPVDQDGVDQNEKDPSIAFADMFLPVLDKVFYGERPAKAAKTDTPAG
jgi:hypothetical protein